MLMRYTNLRFIIIIIIISGYAYGLISVNNSSKKAIIGLLYFTRT